MSPRRGRGRRNGGRAAVLISLVFAGGCSGSGDCTNPDRLFAISDQMGGTATPEEALAAYLPGEFGGGDDFRRLATGSTGVEYEILQDGRVLGTATLDSVGGGWHVNGGEFCS